MTNSISTISGHDITTLRRAVADRSLKSFVYSYFPHRCRLDPSPMHDALFGILPHLDKGEEQGLAFAGPKDHGKTTLVSVAYSIWMMLHGRARHVLIVSESTEAAQGILAKVASELTKNDRLNADFHVEISGRRTRSSSGLICQDDRIVLANGAEMRAMGPSGRVVPRRGGPGRPDLIIADEADPHEDREDSFQRIHRVQRFFSLILKPSKRGAKAVVMGRHFDQEGLLGTLLLSSAGSNWHRGWFSAILTGPGPHGIWHWRQYHDIFQRRASFDGRKGIKAAERYFAAHRDAMTRDTRTLWPALENYPSLMRESARYGEDQVLDTKLTDLACFSWHCSWTDSPPEGITGADRSVEERATLYHRLLGRAYDLQQGGSERLLEAAKSLVQPKVPRRGSTGRRPRDVAAPGVGWSTPFDLQPTARIAMQRDRRPRWHMIMRHYTTLHARDVSDFFD